MREEQRASEREKSSVWRSSRRTTVLASVVVAERSRSSRAIVFPFYAAAARAATLSSPHYNFAVMCTVMGGVE